MNKTEWDQAAAQHDAGEITDREWERKVQEHNASRKSSH